MQELKYQNVDEVDVIKIFETPEGAKPVSVAVEAAPNGWVLVKIAEHAVYLSTTAARELGHTLALVAARVEGSRLRKRHK